jgi:hypothetical protein
MRTLTLVIAPEIPNKETKILKKHYQEALRDPAYTVITNYEVHVATVEYNRDSILVVTAPDLPVPDVTRLQKRIVKARRKKHGLLVVNFELNVQVVSPVC